MTKEEILEYNKRCAEFLGYVNTTPTDKDFNIYQNKDGKMLEPMSMKFHSDWNWIHEVIDVIEILKNKKFKVRIFYNVCEIEKNYKPFINFYFNRKRTKKEAVIQAINQFLIWYKNEKVHSN